MPGRWAVVAHGGAGVIARGDLTRAQEEAYRAGMAKAVEAAAAVLAAGGAAIDAVEAGVRLLEDDPLFNAGRGSVFTAEGRNEMDAAIMEGASLAAGAVAGATRARHPITLARAILEHSPHVFLGGEGAEAFARHRGIEQVDPAWFFTELRWESLEQVLEKQSLPIPPRPPGAPSVPERRAALAHDEGKQRGELLAQVEGKLGTVGVVACDTAGNVAAGTSTGGTTGKRWGRVGDSPLIGAGTYATNAACAVSGTGTGEYFIRLAVAHEICALVEHAGLPLQAALDRVIRGRLTALGGDGGAIAVAPDGEMAWSFNTPGMYRARLAAGEPLVTGIYEDEA